MTTLSTSPNKQLESPDHSECGPAAARRLELSLSPAPKVELVTDTGRVSLQDRVWEYGFDESCSDASLLRLRFVTIDGTPTLDGWAAPVDERGTWLSKPVALVRDELGKLIYTCTRPSEGQEPSIQIFFAVATERVSEGALPTIPPKVEPPTSAQPKLILKPKRTCPTGSGKTGPTLDV